MKILYSISSICLFIFLFSCEQEKKETVTDLGMSIGALHISKVEPKQGDSIHLRYEQRTATSKKEILHSYYTYFVGNKSYPVDIDLKEADGIFTGSLMIPDSANAMVYHFKTGENFEANNKKGYQHVVYDSLGTALLGGDMSLANFNMYMAEFSGIQADKKETLAVMNVTLEKHPELLNIWGNSYGFSLMREDEENGKKFLNKRIEHYSKMTPLTDKDYGQLVNIYRNLKMQAQTDSITKLAIDKFPSGKVAEGVMLDQFFQNRDSENQMTVYKEYIKTYGKESPNANFMAGSLVSAAARNNDIKTVKMFSQNVQNNIQGAGLLNNIAWSMVEKNKNLELAEQLSKKSLDILEALKEKDTPKPDRYSKKQHADAIKSTFLMNVDTYAYILFKRGKLKDALKYQIEAIGEEKVGRADVNERYVQFLLANNKENEAFKEASRFIKINKSTPKIKDYLQQAYTANKDMEGGFDDYLKKLEAEAKEEAFAELKEQMIDEEAFDFSLKNLKGEEVSLSDLKGKTVILDFWATWCGPCINSFPGMQQVVNKYKEDPDIVFLFIDTLENGTPVEIEGNVKKFIAENKYSFNVLFDQPIKEGSRKYVVTENYSIKGIPTKIIIGADGKVKFKSVGYMGSPEQLVEEIDLMIDFLKT